MTTKFAQAVWDPVADRDTRAARVRLMTIHTAVTSSADLYAPSRGQGRTYAHFYNPKNGKLRQHQEIGKIARADYYGNDFCVSVEHWDGYPNGYPGYWKHASDVPPLTAEQVEADAQLFAWLVARHGLPNRIATVDNPTGLGWHRLGCHGNFGAYNPNDRKTWSAKQTGLNLSPNFGKVCPGDRRIDQIDEIYDRAQIILADTYGVKSPRYNELTPQTAERQPMFIIYRPLPTNKKITQYALCAPQYFMVFTGESAAKNLINQLGGKPALKVTNHMWDHCRKASLGK